jgi:hypothetical protein
MRGRHEGVFGSGRPFFNSRDAICEKQRPSDTFASSGSRQRSASVSERHAVGLPVFSSSLSIKNVESVLV